MRENGAMILRTILARCLDAVEMSGCEKTHNPPVMTGASIQKYIYTYVYVRTYSLFKRTTKLEERELHDTISRRVELSS